MPQQSLFCQFSADLLYRQVSSNSSHYTDRSGQVCCTTKSQPTAVTILSSVQLCCTAKSQPTAFTILPVQGSPVVQPSLIPQQSIYCQFSAAFLYSQVLSHSSHYTASSVQLCCTAKSHPTAVTILPFQAALLYKQNSSHSSHYSGSSVQLCCTAKSHPTAITKLPVQCSSVVQT